MGPTEQAIGFGISYVDDASAPFEQAYANFQKSIEALHDIFAQIPLLILRSEKAMLSFSNTMKMNTDVIAGNAQKISSAMSDIRKADPEDVAGKIIEPMRKQGFWKGIFKDWAKIFGKGTKTFLAPIGKGLSNIASSFTNRIRNTIRGIFGSTVGQIVSIISLVAIIDKIFGPVIRAVEDLVSILIAPLQNFLSMMVYELTPYVRRMAVALSTYLASIMPQAQKYMRQFGESLITFAKNAIPVIVALKDFFLWGVKVVKTVVVAIKESKTLRYGLITLGGVLVGLKLYFMSVGSSVSVVAFALRHLVIFTITKAIPALFTLGTAVLRVATVIMARLVPAIWATTKAVIAFLVSNPIGWIITAIGLAIGALLYFTGLWDKLLAIVKSVANAIAGVFGFGGAEETGAATMTAFGEGIRTGGIETVQATEDVFRDVDRLLPRSDAQEGPFSRLTEAGASLVETFAEGVERGSGRLTSAVDGMFAGVNLRPGGGPGVARPIYAPSVATPGLTIAEKRALSPEEQNRPVVEEIRKWGEKWERWVTGGPATPEDRTPGGAKEAMRSATNEAVGSFVINLMEAFF